MERYSFSMKRMLTTPYRIILSISKITTPSYCVRHQWNKENCTHYFDSFPRNEMRSCVILSTSQYKSVIFLFTGYDPSEVDKTFEQIYFSVLYPFNKRLARFFCGSPKSELVLFIKFHKCYQTKTLKEAKRVTRMVKNTLAYLARLRYALEESLWGMHIHEITQQSKHTFGDYKFLAYGVDRKNLLREITSYHRDKKYREERTIRPYPGSPDNFRGIGCDVMFFEDEIPFIPKRLPELIKSLDQERFPDTEEENLNQGSLLQEEEDEDTDEDDLPELEPGTPPPTDVAFRISQRKGG